MERHGELEESIRKYMQVQGFSAAYLSLKFLMRDIISCCTAQNNTSLVWLPLKGNVQKLRDLWKDQIPTIRP